jgi:hypothetical protein
MQEMTKSLRHGTGVVAALVGVLALGCFSAVSQAQPCAPRWLAGDGANGISGDAYTSIVLPNGDLVVGGRFSVAGGIKAGNIARLDHQTGQWSPMGSGVNGAVQALALLPNGDVVAGGMFTAAGEGPAAYLARWNGTGWSAFNGEPNQPVYALAVLTNGDLVVGGEFSSVAGVTRNRVAQWNEASGWSSMGTGMNGFVLALAALPGGGVMAGGSFETAGGTPASRVARWNGSAWSAAGNGLNSSVRSLLAQPNGDVYAAGDFDRTGATFTSGVARWNGAAWSAAATGSNTMRSARAVMRLSNGGLVASGQVAFIHSVARLSNNDWVTLSGSSSLEINTLTEMPDGSMIAGGRYASFVTPSQVLATGIGRLSGSQWQAVGAANGTVIRPFTVLADGRLLGLRTGDMSTDVAVWNGASWDILGTGAGFTGFGRVIAAAALLANGDIVIGGSFAAADGTSVNSVARWNGAGWSRMGSGQSAIINDLAVLPDGKLVAAGWQLGAGITNNVATWSGSEWIPVGGGTDNEVESLSVLPNGDLVVAGHFARAGEVTVSLIARWNGITWAPLGAGVNTPQGPANVADTAVLHNGDLVATGQFSHAGGSPASGEARWAGSAWFPMGAGHSVGNLPTGSALTVLANGDLVVGGLFGSAGGLAANNIAVWSGGAWSPLGSGVDGEVRRVVQLPNGDLFATGSFGIAGDQVSVGAARWWQPSADFNGDGDFGTDQDIEAFFACLSGACCLNCGSGDFNGDGDFGTDQDIESFFRVLSGAAC